MATKPSLGSLLVSSEPATSFFSEHFSVTWSCSHPLLCENLLYFQMSLSKQLKWAFTINIQSLLLLPWFYFYFSLFGPSLVLVCSLGYGVCNCLLGKPLNSGLRLSPLLLGSGTGPHGDTLFRPWTVLVFIEDIQVQRALTSLICSVCMFFISLLDGLPPVLQCNYITFSISFYTLCQL